MAGGHAGLEIIVGSMFSGKSEELIRRVKRAVIARRAVQVFKPAVDDRFGAEIVRSHDGDTFLARPVRGSAEITDLVGPETSVVGIDEVQFFDDGIVGVVRSLVASGRRVICAGLDLDFRGEPFGSVPVLLALAERVEKLEAICVVCGEPATRTQRIVNGVPAFYDEPIIVIGAKEAYEARCRSCHDVPRRSAVEA
ncbi:MAG TPA: thymidine kinase [Candidatus Limnocylindria bacterium]|nr:thymidine kinase [Candidatus Limnocylindria bacterium]